MLWNRNENTDYRLNYDVTVGRWNLGTDVIMHNVFELHLGNDETEADVIGTF